MSVTAIVPAATQAKLAALVQALDLPDVTAIDLDKFAPEDLATFVYSLEQQLEAAENAFEAACAAARQAVEIARERVKAAIVAAGGKALPHDTFDVRLSQRTERVKRIDVLRRLEGVLPADLYREAVYVKALDLKHCRDPKVVQEAILAGAEPTWEANLTKLNKFARDFGGDIAKIVDEGAPTVEIGTPRLHIEPRGSALKSVSP